MSLPGRFRPLVVALCVLSACRAESAAPQPTNRPGPVQAATTRMLRALSIAQSFALVEAQPPVAPAPASSVVEPGDDELAVHAAVGDGDRAPEAARGAGRPGGAPVAARPARTASGVATPARSTEVSATATTAEARVVKVRHGENLTVLARLAGVKPEAIAKASGRPESARLAIGDELTLPPGAAADFDARRAAFEQQRLDAFVASRGGLRDVADHAIRKGETVAGLAERQRVPLWVLLHFNDGRPLDRLAIGDVVKLPVLN